MNMYENLKTPNNIKEYPFTPIPHVILDVLIADKRFDKNCQKVLLLIIRLTYGIDLKKKRRGRWADIRKSQFRACGISSTHIDPILEKLLAMEVIRKEPPNYYSINVDTFESSLEGYLLSDLLCLHISQPKATADTSSERLINLSSQNGIYLEKSDVG